MILDMIITVFSNAHFEVYSSWDYLAKTNFGWASALSQYTSPPLKSVSPVILAHSCTLWNHTSLVSKREKSTPLILTPPLSLKRHSSSFKYEKVSNSQPTGGAQQTRYIQKQWGPWQVYEWGFGCIVVWVQVIPGQGRSLPQAGTRTPCCTSTNEYSQPTMNTQNLYKPKSIQPSYNSPGQVISFHFSER